MSDAINSLEYSADLVRHLGKSKLPNGNTLSESLTLDGISLWDVVSPILATLTFPKELSQTPPNIIVRKCKPYLSMWKHFIYKKTKRSRKQDYEDHNVFLEKNSIFFLGFSDYIYRDVLFPVEQYFGENENMNYFIFHDEGYLNRSSSKLHGYRFRSIWKYNNEDVSVKELIYKKKYDIAVKYLLDGRVLQNIVSASEKTTWSHLELPLKWLFKVYFPSLIPYLARTQFIFRNYPPSVVISPDVADPRTRIFCLISNLKKIPTLELQFGMYGKEAVEWQFNISDRVAVWGNQAEKILMSHHVQKEKITITGSPRFDRIIELNHGSEIVRKRFNIPKNNYFALFASQYSLDQYSKFGDYRNILKNIKRTIFRVSQQFPEITLIVKPHPFEDVEDTKNLASGFNTIIFADPKEDIRELIKECDVFITLGTTATMDALLANKLVIFPDSPGFVWWDDIYLKNNVCLVPKSEKEFIHYLQMVVNGQKEILMKDLEDSRKKFLSEWIYKLDGNASKRIAALAMEMIKDSTK